MMNLQEKYDWMVYVSCMTFNHAPYIVDAMNGFTMQKTEFPFVCAIVDDASTDGEQGVIKNYLAEHFDLEDKKVARHEETDDYILTFARHKTNLNCFFAVLYLKYNHYKKKSKEPYLARWRAKAKYIAMCEGDDYWIDCNKLQYQASYLGNNPKCGCIFSDYDIVDSKSLVLDNDDIPELYRKMKNNVTDGRIFAKLFNNSSCVMTCTIMYRKAFSHQYLIDHDRIFDIASKSELKYYNTRTACYRINPNGLMRSQQKFVNTRLFQCISNWMITYYSFTLDPNLYNKETLKEVRIFFSKYFTEFLKNNRQTSSNIVFYCIRRDWKLLVYTPFNILRRIVKN